MDPDTLDEMAEAVAEIQKRRVKVGGGYKDSPRRVYLARRAIDESQNDLPHRGRRWLVDEIDAGGSGVRVIRVRDTDTFASYIQVQDEVERGGMGKRGMMVEVTDLDRGGRDE